MWEIYELVGEVHVIPRADEKDHIKSGDCSCEPRLEVMNNGGKVYIHDSFDGRVAVEMAKEILNQNNNENESIG
jgi:hypothetical protein